MNRAELNALMRDAAQARNDGRWSEALDQYMRIDCALGGRSPAAIQHNIGLCHLALQRPEVAAEYAERALKLEPALWQSRIVLGRSLRAQGRIDEAQQEFSRVVDTDPLNEEARLALSSLALHEYGDAAAAQFWVEPLLLAANDHEARLAALVAELYDTSRSGENVSSDFRSYAAQHMVLPADTDSVSENRKKRTPRSRLRVGLLSPHFSCSPVYFLCFGALQLLSPEVDFVMVGRSVRSDWASREFRSIAKEWHDAADKNPEPLSNFLRALKLDVLIDLGGWMDPAAMHALSNRPVERQYKWVGGQSLTTGLSCFDGFLGDYHQSPRSLQSLYAEPLVLLESGYVSYSAPEYLPAPAQPNVQKTVLGIVANPAKISRQFLEVLAAQIDAIDDAAAQPVEIRFIDRRFQHRVVQDRVLDTLRQHAHAVRDDRVGVNFKVPPKHLEFLNEVGQLDAIVDTFPYTGGLTTIEAYALGVPCYTRKGKLFSQRHTFAHAKYCRLAKEDYDIEYFVTAVVSGRLKRSSVRTSLLHGSKRTDHAALAKALHQVLTA